MQVVCCMLSQKASGICGPITFSSLFLVLYNETKRGNGRDMTENGHLSEIS